MATLKVITSVLLLPFVYVGAGAIVGLNVGLWWGVAVTTVLPLSFLAFIKVVEVQANMTLATLTNLKLSRFAQEVDELRETRSHLVERVRAVADTHADHSLPRVFSRGDLD